MTHPDPTAETLPNVQEPNPYAYSVLVASTITREWAVRLIGRRSGVPRLTLNTFPTEEEADTHAALILAALHEAVME